MGEGLGVRIRPVALEDQSALYGAVRESLPELMRWMWWCHADYSPAEARTWLEAQVKAFSERTEFHFALEAQGGEFLGVGGISSFDKVNRRANLGYWVRSGRTGRGVASGAVGQLAEWTFENTDVARLEIVVAVENAASLRVAAKAGAVREGVLGKRLVLGGRAHDAVMFALTR